MVSVSRLDARERGVWVGWNLHIGDIIQVDNDDRVLTVDAFTNANKVFGLEGDVGERDALGRDAHIGELDML